MAAPETESLTWSHSGGATTRHGCFPRAVKVKAPPEEAFKTEGAVQASVVFDRDHRVFVADMAGLVQSFSKEGKLLWRTRLPGGISATPAVHPTQPWVFLGTHQGIACALDARDGNVVWQREISTQGDPRILSDLLFWPAAEAVVLSSWGEKFCGLNAASGKEQFSWNAGISPSSGATCLPEGNLFCLRAVQNSGTEFVEVTPDGREKILLSLPEDTRGARRTLVAAAPVIDRRRAVSYAIMNRKEGCVLIAWSLENEKVLWKHNWGHSVQGTPTIRNDGSVVLFDLGGNVICLSAGGEMAFTYHAGCEYLLAGGVCESSGNFYFGDPVGLVHVIDAHGKGTVLYESDRAIQARLSFGPDGLLWVPSTNKKVYRFPA